MAWLRGLGLLLLLPALGARAQTDAPGFQDLFRQGRVELDAGAGLGALGGRDYLLLLLGAGYYVREGLSVGATGEAWLGSQPQLGDVSPALRYVFLGSSWNCKPYLGAFYRRTFFNHEQSPLDSSGARAGVVFPLSGRAYLTGGLVYEHYFSCTGSIFANCDQVYPEIGLAVAL